MVVCAEDDEPRIAAILSEMSLPGAGVGEAVVTGGLRSLDVVCVRAMAPLDSLAPIRLAGVEAGVGEGVARVVAAALPGRLPPKWAAMAAARAALDGIGPSPTMLRSAAAGKDGGAMDG
jgi:hypothetical protein